MYDYKDVPVQNCIDDCASYDTAIWVCDGDSLKAHFDVEPAEVEYEEYERRLKEWN